MKIAFLVTEFPVLSETFILNQITGLIDAGHDVEIFSQLVPVSEKQHADVEKYGLRKRTSYLVSLPANRILRLSKAVFLAVMHAYKAPVMVLKALNVFKYGNVRLIYALAPFLGKRFDVLHCHFGPNGVLGVQLTELGVSGKVLTSFHGYDVNNYPLEAGKDVYKELFAKGTRFTANTHFTQKQAVALGCPREKMDIIPESLNIEEFKYSEKTLKPGEPVRLLTIARLVEKKGHAYAIKAVANVLKKHKDIRYTIAGDGPLRGELESLVAELGVEPQVLFVGNITQDEARLLYEQSHIFILPSVTAKNEDREGQALVLQEAQACGLPVLSTLHNGIPEGVLDGKSGFLVGERDVAALAERLEYLIVNFSIWPQMGRIGRQFVEGKFERTLLSRNLIDIYHAAVGSGE
ncbi:MAG: glycosyltransferase [Candidatus Omnitrophica bacterium]|nr:glycosyltransferase [Candidatus Omnitrophota bacterium]MBU4477597.1 glycosyltransferase [Candidatus Omnitrophota bacterium]MCG2702804.1 glycosyltransferase [Candidatus Omnitrophota bacterium]